MMNETYLTHISTLFQRGIDLQHRRIYLTGPIQGEDEEGFGVAYPALRAIDLFNEDSKRKDEPIEIVVCSDGGHVDLMFSLYDAIRSSKSPIHTIGTGSICSAAVLILAAGHVRFATENAWLMHHLSKDFDSTGDEREIEAKAEMTKRMADQTYKLLAKHTKKNAKYWENSARDKGEIWLNSEEMLTWGVIDEVIKNPAKIRKPRKASIKKEVDATTSTD